MRRTYSRRDKALKSRPGIFYPDQVEQLLGIHRATLHHWNKTGLYRPRKTRVRLRYDIVDVCILACFALLKRRGVSGIKLRRSYAEGIRTGVLSRIEEKTQLRDLRFALLDSGAAEVFLKADVLPEPAVEILHFDELQDMLNQSKKLLVSGGQQLRDL